MLAALEDVGVAWITSRLKRADPLRRDYRSHPGEGPFVGLYVVVFLPTPWSDGEGEMDARYTSLRSCSSPASKKRAQS